MKYLGMRHHPPMTCPRCGARRVPVYELAVPPATEGQKMGALNLASHNCPDGGDHLRVQKAVTIPVGIDVEDQETQ
jgi:hypothetical protein